MERLILLNYSFKMEFLLSHADGLSKLITKLCEPLEDTVIATLEATDDIKNVLWNTARDRPVTLD